MVSTVLTRIKSHVIDVNSNCERMSFAGFALHSPELHQIQYVPVEGWCCNLREPGVSHKRLGFTTLQTCLALLRNAVVIVSANRRRPCLNFSFVGWMM
jgi:hypothetical protein